MLVICEECGKKYRINPEMIKGDQASFTCKVCSHRIVVTKPVDAPPEPSREPIPDTSPAPSPEPSPEPSVSPSPESLPPSPAPAASAPVVMPGAGSRSGGGGRRFGIAAKAMALLLTLCLIPLVLYWAFTFRQTRTLIKADTARLSDEASRYLTNTVDEWVDKNLLVLKAFAALDDMQSMDPARQEPMLKAIQEQYPWMYLVFTVAPNGMNVARNDGNPLVSYADRQYYKDVMAGKPMAWQNVIGRTSKKPALILAVPIKRGDQVVGVLANAMVISYISQHIVNWRQGETGMSFLLDESGKVIVHQESQLVAEQKDLSGHPLVVALKAGQTGSVYYTDNGRSYIGHVSQTRLGWVLAILQQEDEAFQVLGDIQLFSVLFLGAVFILVMVAAIISSRQMAKPILSLTDAADRISLGELDFNIEANRKDEIGDLAEAMKRMQDSLRLSIERLRRRR